MLNIQLNFIYPLSQGKQSYLKIPKFGWKLLQRRTIHLNNLLMTSKNFLKITPGRFHFYPLQSEARNLPSPRDAKSNSTDNNWGKQSMTKMNLTKKEMVNTRPSEQGLIDKKEPVESREYN